MATVSWGISDPLIQENSAPRSVRRGFWLRLYDALVEAQMRKARLEISRYKHLIPADELEQAHYRVGQNNSNELPFVR